MAVWKPMSIFERKELAKELREEAANKIAEAERIEEGIKADEQVMIDAAKRAFESLAKQKESE